MKIRRPLILSVLLATGLLMLSCNSLTPLIGKETTALYPIRQNNRNGYINRRGEVVIQPQFAFTLPFSEGLAPVCSAQGKCGYIDETGKFVINPQFDAVARFSDGLAAVSLSGKIGYVDKSGKYVINPQFAISGSGGPGMDGLIWSTFSEGLAVARIGDKSGYIDKTGKIVINPQFEEALPFFDGLAATRTGGKWGFVDKEGKIVINPQFDEATPYINGLAAVRIGKQFGYVDRTGKIAINPQFDDASPFSEDGLAAVTLDQKVGFIDKEGKYVINPQFGRGTHERPMMAFMVTAEIGRASFSEGLTPVQVGDKPGGLGYIDKTGKIVINPQFYEAFPFYGGLAAVVLDGGGPGGQLAWIDPAGKIVWRESKTPEPTTVANNGSGPSGSAPAVNAPPANYPANTPPSTATSGRTGRLTTDSNIRSESNKDSASLGIHFKGAKLRIIDETSYPIGEELSTWYKVKITEYGCSVNTSLGCGKNSPNDSDEGWVNAKNVLVD